MKRFINIKMNNEVETVDEFDYNTSEERKEFRRCLNEYRIADRYNNYYGSQRCADDWKHKS